MLQEQHITSARGCHYAAQIALLVVVQRVDTDVCQDLGCNESHVQLVGDVQCVTAVLRWYSVSAGEQDLTFNLRGSLDRS